MRWERVRPHTAFRFHPPSRLPKISRNFRLLRKEVLKLGPKERASSAQHVEPTDKTDWTSWHTGNRNHTDETQMTRNGHFSKIQSHWEPPFWVLVFSALVLSNWCLFVFHKPSFASEKFSSQKGQNSKFVHEKLDDSYTAQLLWLWDSIPKHQVVKTKTPSRQKLTPTGTKELHLLGQCGTEWVDVDTWSWWEEVLLWRLHLNLWCMHTQTEPSVRPSACMAALVYRD